MKITDRHRLLQLALAPDTEVPSERLREKCVRCAIDNTPSEVRVVLIREDGTGGLSHLGRESAQFGLLEAPRPTTRRGLYVYLHECAHFRLHIDTEHSSTNHLREFQAERFAIGVMKRSRIRIPPEELFLAKENVRAAIIRDQARGKKIAARARRFADSRQTENSRLLLRLAVALLMLCFSPLTIVTLYLMSTHLSHEPVQAFEPALQPAHEATQEQIDRWRYLEQYLAKHPPSPEAMDELNRGATAK